MRYSLQISHAPAPPIIDITNTFVSQASSPDRPKTASPSEGWPWFAENGILETVQVLILLVMLARYLFLVTRHAAVLRAIFGGAAMITLACIIREVEFDPNGELGWADRIIRGPGRITAGVIAIPVSLYGLRATFREPRALPRLLLGDWWGRTCIAGGLIVLLAGLYDRGILLDLPSNRWEEAFETLGYLLVACSAFIPPRAAEAVISRPLRRFDRTPRRAVKPDRGTTPKTPCSNPTLPCGVIDPERATRVPPLPSALQRDPGCHRGS